MRRSPLLVTALFLVAVIPSLTSAQTFSSGSTGADGALRPDAEGPCVGDGYYHCSIQVPESGVLNFTTIDTGPYSIRFKPNSRNTPVYVLATGDVRISAAFEVSASGNTPGAGGYWGGNTQFRNGFGPGGGTQASPSGRWVGALSLSPIEGGSGGYAIDDSGIYEAGGGGGAIVIASSTQVVVTGTITVAGGNGSHGDNHGSGGAIRIVANSITVASTATLNALGGNSNASNPGMIRLEAPPGANQFLGTAQPSAVQSDINPLVVPGASTPSLTIVSLAGYPVSATRFSGFNRTAADIVIPAAVADPIALVVNGANIPVGSTVSVVATGSPISATGGVLTGASAAATTTTLQVSGLVRTSLTHLFLSTTFDVVAGGGNAAGPDQVARVRVESEFSGATRYVFLRKDGSVVPAERLKPEFLARYGR